MPPEQTLPSTLAFELQPVEFAPPTIEAADSDGKPRLRSFSMVGYSGGLMTRLAGFPYPVVASIDGIRIAKRTPILIEHGWAASSKARSAFGHATKVAKKGGQLLVEGVVSGVGSEVQQVLAMADNGFPFQASQTVEIDRGALTFVPEGEKVQVNGRTFEGPIYHAASGSLREISVVVIGADQDTETTIAARAAQETPTMKPETTLPVANPAGTTTLAATATPAGTGPAPDAPTIAAAQQPQLGDIVAQAERRIAETYQRFAQIDLLAKDHPEIRAKAVAEGWTLDKVKDQVELATVRAGRGPGGGPAIIVRKHEFSPEVLQAAACLAGGLSSVEKAFDEKTLEAASSQFRRGITLNELLLECAWEGGFTGRTMRGHESEVIRAAFSQLATPGILSNVANKFLHESFMAVEDAWRRVAAIGSVTDFKQISSYRLTGDLTFDEVGPTGELKHGTGKELEYTNRAKTYGRMFSVTRQDLINDDLGALTKVPARIGRGSALKLNEVFWTEFLANHGAFFFAGNNNYIEGADTALSINSVTALEAKFLDQTDGDGNPLAIMPKTLLVPNALKVAAEVIFNSRELRDTTASTKAGTTNPHAGKYAPVASAYLNNAKIAGGSATAFYLLADPAVLATMEVVFLNGQQQPTVEQAEADFNVLGIQMRGYFDFGVAKQEFRAGAKSKGAA